MTVKSLLASAVVLWVVPNLASAEDDNGTPFDSISFVGGANLIAGELTEEDGSNVASGGVGFIAATNTWTLRGVFTFGTAGASEDDATAKDYINFLQVPASALGFDLHLAYLREVGKSNIWLGGSVNLRASHQEFGFVDGASESIKAIGLDPSLSLSIPLDPPKGISFAVEAGFAARFWNKPSSAFIEALDLDSSKHAFFGVHGLAAMNIGNIHVGIEMMRLWGGDIDELKEFAIIPYVGFRGVLAPPPPPPPPCTCDDSKRDTRRTPLPFVTPSLLLPPTQAM